MFRQTQVLVGDGYIYEYLCVISNSHFILSMNLLEVINLRFPICSTQNAANLPVELCFFGVSDQPAVKPWKVGDFRPLMRCHLKKILKECGDNSWGPRLR